MCIHYTSSSWGHNQRALANKEDFAMSCVTIDNTQKTSPILSDETFAPGF